MILNVQEKYNEIEQDLMENEEYVFKIRNHYSRKYSKDSNRLNDVNVGLFLDDNFNPVAQIFVRNKTGYIKSHLVFNYEGTKVKEVKMLNYKIN
ncbi:MAG TPA: hypothetical protein VF680_16930 [Allosphingosinicella sp.]|jgi:hypothetical protein